MAHTTVTLNTSTATAQAILYARESDPYGDRKDYANAERVKLGGVKIETSLETQIKEEREKALEVGASINFDDIYMERYTGVDSIFDRPMLDEIRTKIRAGKYRYFICYSSDRLGRDIEIAFIMKECMKHNCELLFVHEPVENSEIGQVILFLKGWGDRMEVMKFKDRVRRARKAIVDAGRIYVHGDPLYGYDFDKKLHTRVVNPEKSKVVEMIFTLAAEGYSAKAIAEKLDGRNIPPPSAGRRYRDESRVPRWGTTQINRILNTEEYLGYTYVNKHQMTEKRRRNGKYESEMKSKSEWVRIDDPTVTPRIISQDLWDRAHQGLKSRYKNHGVSKRHMQLVPYLLRGIIHCSECGLKMYPMPETTHYRGGRTERVRVYRCSAKLGGKLEAPTCSCGRVFAEEVEAQVWDKVVSFFRQPEVIEAEVRRILDDMPTDTVENDLESIRADLSKSEKLYGKMYAKLTRALADDDDMLATRLEADCKRLAEEIKAYQNVAGQLEAKLAAKERTAEIAREFAGYCRKVSDAFDTVDIPFERKVQMLSAVRVKVFAHSNGTLKLRTNLGALIEVASAKTLDVNRTGTAWGRRPPSAGCSSARLMRAD